MAAARASAMRAVDAEKKFKENEEAYRAQVEAALQEDHERSLLLESLGINADADESANPSAQVTAADALVVIALAMIDPELAIQELSILESYEEVIEVDEVNAATRPKSVSDASKGSNDSGGGAMVLTGGHGVKIMSAAEETASENTGGDTTGKPEGTDVGETSILRTPTKPARLFLRAMKSKLPRLDSHAGKRGQCRLCGKVMGNSYATVHNSCLKKQLQIDAFKGGDRAQTHAEMVAEKEEASKEEDAEKEEDQSVVGNIVGAIVHGYCRVCFRKLENRYATIHQSCHEAVSVAR